ncbi:MAG TPA: MqnA/MqnD/SBP family protein [Polyangiales bacterium]|nr:MqnA/MqnD/SBP family protein [Polyangiales bacterium]
MSYSRTIRVAYSPDADDAFMFWAIAEGHIDTHGIHFERERADTEALNLAAESTRAPDVSAVSIHQYAYLTERYLLLPHGGSVGAGYGPVVVAKEPRSIDQLRGLRIGVPGMRTSAYLVLRLLVPEFTPVIVPVAPFSRAFDALRSGEVDATLLIHEGRLLYEREGFSRALELGEAWKAMTGLPLPLGGNVIARALGPELIAEVSSLLRESIRYALTHRDEALSSLLANESRPGVPRERALFDRYLSMYANQDTLDYGELGRRAIQDLFDRGHKAGIIPHPVLAEFAP